LLPRRRSFGDTWSDGVYRDVRTIGRAQQQSAKALTGEYKLIDERSRYRKSIVLEDLFTKDLRVVFCRTAAGTRSAQLQQYYAGRGNKFWKILAQVGLTPKVLLPSEYRELLAYGIGLTDMVKGQSGGDADIDFKGTATS
jgi:hypothetical protein